MNTTLGTVQNNLETINVFFYNQMESFYFLCFDIPSLFYDYNPDVFCSIKHKWITYLHLSAL